MRKRNDNNNEQLNNEQQSESLFERLFREERTKKLAENDALFFGLTVLFALYATQGMFTIQ